jgi:hypothetical protein
LKEVLDKVSPFVLFRVVVGRVQPLGSWRNLGLYSALLQITTQPIGIIGLVAQQRTEVEPIEQGRHAGCFPALSGHKAKAHKVSQCID